MSVVYLVVCAAPPARRIEELVSLLQQDGWSVQVIATPTAGEWINRAALTVQTGYRVHVERRGPEDSPSLPEAAAVAVVPATFNTINKWAAGINDTLALGVLNEALGIGLPIVVSPYAKPALASHPAFARSLQVLREAGVHLTETEALRPDKPERPFRWQVIVKALAAVRRGTVG